MAYYGSNYPSNSGPPPPPGGFGGGGYPPSGGYGGYGGYGGGYGGGSAYNVNPYQTGHCPPPGSYGGGYQSAAVAGFTAPPALPVPPSRQYAMANQQFQPYGCQAQMLQQMAFQTDPRVEEIQRLERQLEAERNQQRRFRDQDDEAEIAKRELERVKQLQELQEKVLKEAQEKLANDDSMKESMRKMFIDELMRRQDVNGTFEDTSGVVSALVEYSEDDPVAVWFKKEKNDDLSSSKWDALFDAEYLRFGIKGLGTNEQAIIDVVATRTNRQRNQVMKEYKTAYGRDLIEDLRDELSGDFKEAILACFETPARYDAWCIKRSIYGLGTNEDTLIEILLTRTNAQIHELAGEYNAITYEKQRDPSKSLEEDIEGDCSGDFKRLLISASTGGRRTVSREQVEQAVEEIIVNDKWTGMFQINYEKLVNMDRCRRYADELFKAGEDRWGTDEETFNRVFSTQDYYTLRMIWDLYVKKSQRDITNSVERETSGDLKKGLLTIAQVIKCRPMAFAERLYKAMKGLGTDDSTLIRIVVSRSEIDMKQIKACFLERYKQTLWNFIKDDTSGDYRKLLCGIVGKN